MDRSAVSTEERPVPRLVLVSSRPLIGVLFQEVVERQGLDVELVSESRRPLSRLGEQLSGAGAAIIDVGADPAAAVELCRELHEAHPRLPLVALACCSRSLSPSQLRMFIRAGVRTVLDLDARPEQLLGALETAAEGGSTLQLTLEPAAADFLRELVSSPGPRSATKIALLELVSLGLPEREIGRRLHLSPHTVKHHIEDLRRELRLANRIELAAWAGRHGFYRPGPDSRAF